MGGGDSVYRIVRADFVHTNLEGDSVYRIARGILYIGIGGGVP